MRKAATHHVPGKIGQPVDGRVDATDKLQMLGLAHPLLDEEEDKAGGDEGHGEDNADGHHHVGGARRPAHKQAHSSTEIKKKKKKKTSDLQLSGKPLKESSEIFLVLICTLKAKAITHDCTCMDEKNRKERLSTAPLRESIKGMFD